MTSGGWYRPAARTAIAVPEEVVQEAGDAIGEHIRFQIVVQWIVVIGTIHSDLEIIPFAAMPFQDSVHSVAEVAVDFENEADRALGCIPRVMRGFASAKGYMQQLVLPEPNATEYRNAGEESAIWNSHPSRLIDGLRRFGWCHFTDD